MELVFGDQVVAVAEGDFEVAGGFVFAGASDVLGQADAGLFAELDEDRFHLIFFQMEVDVEHVGDGLARDGFDGVASVEQGGQFLGGFVVVGHLVDALFEVVVGGEDVGVEGDQVAAVAFFPDFCFPGEGVVACEDRACYAADAFVEGDVDAVEEGADFGGGFLVVRQDFEQAGAVELEVDALGAAEFGDRHELFVGRELAADFALGQFEQQAGDVVGHVKDFFEADQAVFVPEEDGFDAVELLEAVFFVDFEVGQGVVGDALDTFAVAPDAKGDLLGHGAAGEEDGGRLAEAGGHFGLEVFDDGAGAVHVAVEGAGEVGDGVLQDVEGAFAVAGDLVGRLVEGLEEGGGLGHLVVGSFVCNSGVEQGRDGEMAGSFLVKAGWAGVVAGVVLGLFLKAVEWGTQVKVYTLLLNLDYVPVLQRYAFPEIVEFGIHVGISVGLSVVLGLYMRYRKFAAEQVVRFVVLVSLVVGVLLYPTTALSERTPALTSVPAVIFWLTGHGLYGWVLGWLVRRDIFTFKE